jgi:hypothetical protein
VRGGSGWWLAHHRAWSWAVVPASKKHAQHFSEKHSLRRNCASLGSHADFATDLYSSPILHLIGPALLALFLIAPTVTFVGIQFGRFAGSSDIVAGGREECRDCGFPPVVTVIHVREVDVNNAVMRVTHVHTHWHCPVRYRNH